MNPQLYPLAQQYFDLSNARGWGILSLLIVIYLLIDNYFYVRRKFPRKIVYYRGFAMGIFLFWMCVSLVEFIFFKW